MEILLREGGKIRLLASAVSDSVDKIGSRFEIFAEWSLDLRSYRVHICSNIGVKHDRDLACSRIVPIFRPSITINTNFLGQFVNALIVHMREQIRSQFSCTREGLGIACGCQPDRDIALNRWRVCFQFNDFPIAPFKWDSFTAPELAHDLDI